MRYAVVAIAVALAACGNGRPAAVSEADVTATADIPEEQRVAVYEFARMFAREDAGQSAWNACVEENGPTDSQCGLVAIRAMNASDAYFETFTECRGERRGGHAQVHRMRDRECYQQANAARDAVLNQPLQI
ncbi:MAG: hypothetical protein AB7G06_06995 [Bdellovibrionales bacterium]